MNKRTTLYLLLLSFCLVLTGCGIQPPTQDLEMAKAKLAEAEEVEAPQYAPDEYTKAKDLIDKGSSVMVNEKSGKNKDARKNFTSAKAEAEKAFAKAAPPYTEKSISELEASLNKGKEIKADVAVKDEYGQAQQLLSEAREAYNSKDYKTSYTKAKSAKEMAEKAYQTALDKKTRTENAIDEAKKGLAEAEKEQK